MLNQACDKSCSPRFSVGGREQPFVINCDMASTPNLGKNVVNSALGKDWAKPCPDRKRLVQSCTTMSLRRSFRSATSSAGKFTPEPHLAHIPARTCSGSSCTFSVENLGRNGFEQLCRNYSAEKLRGKFLQDEVCGAGAVGCGTWREANKAWATDATIHVENMRQLLDTFEGELKGIALDEALQPTCYTDRSLPRL